MAEACPCGLPIRSRGLCLWHYGAARRARLDPDTDREQILKLGIHPGKFRQFPGWEREILQQALHEALSKLAASEAREQLQRHQIETLSRQHLQDTRQIRDLEREWERALSELEREQERGKILESQLSRSRPADPPDARLAAAEEEIRLLRRKLASLRKP